MSEALKDAWSVRPTDSPWDEWRTAYPLIGAAIEATSDTHQRPPTSDRYADAPTSELLALEKVTLARRVARVLASRAGDEDVKLMLHAAEDPSLAMHVAAVNALAFQQHTEVLPAVLTLSDETGRGLTRALLFRAFEALPFAATRATATEWLTGGDRTRRAAAASALGAHAIDDDVCLISAELSRELDQGLSGDQYVACALAEALGRHPEYGPYPELDRAFSEMPYSFGRGYVVTAIAATDRQFPDKLAVTASGTASPRYAPQVPNTYTARNPALRLDSSRCAPTRSNTRNREKPQGRAPHPLQGSEAAFTNRARSSRPTRPDPLRQPLEPCTGTLVLLEGFEKTSDEHPGRGAQYAAKRSVRPSELLNAGVERNQPMRLANNR